MIEFKCSECGKQLRVKDDAAGKKGKCPQCGTVLLVPAKQESSLQPADSRPNDGIGDVEQRTAPPTTEGANPRAGAADAQKAPSPVANDTRSEYLDNPIKIALAAGGVGLVILALSPLFKWINFGAGGVTGISGDGKIVLGITVVSIIALGLAVFARRRIAAASLGVGAWGTIALFWMGGLIWKVGSLLESSEAEGNPFAAMLATQVSPGSGLYIGLIGGLIAAGALGYVAYRQLQEAGRPRVFYIGQVCALVLGVLVAAVVGPDSKPTSSNSASLSSGSPFSEPKEEVTSIAQGEQTQLGQAMIEVLGAWRGPLSVEVRSSFSSETRVRHYSTPVLMLALRATNTSEGQVFSVAPSHSDPWELCTVTDRHGNRSSASAIAQYESWPPSSLQVGEQPTKLKPGESTVLVFVVDELENADADTFTWNLDCYVDNDFSKHKVSVVTPADEVKFPRTAVEAQVQHLQGLRAEAEAAKASLAKFEVVQARFYFSEDRFSSDPVIDLTVRNGTGHTVSRFYCRGVLSSPGRATPWVEDTFNYSVRGGIQPDETRQFKLAPNMFGEWGKAPKDRDDLEFSVTVYRLDGPDEEELFASTFSEDDAARLAALEAMIRKHGP